MMEQESEEEEVQIKKYFTVYIPSTYVQTHIMLLSAMLLIDFFKRQCTVINKKSPLKSVTYISFHLLISIEQFNR